MRWRKILALAALFYAALLAGCAGETAEPPALGRAEETETEEQFTDDFESGATEKWEGAEGDGEAEEADDEEDAADDKDGDR